MQTAAQLGFPAERNSQIARMINEDFKAKGILVTGLSSKQYDELMRLSTSENRSQTAYVDTCGSKVFVRDPSKCKDGTVHNLATPVKITMGKGFVMASRVGVIEFVFKDNGDRNVVVLLPALVCEDFDTDLVILSGPMLNSVNIGIGPTTNYRDLISLDGKDAGLRYTGQAPHP